MAGYIIKVQIEHTNPLVWRRIIIPDQISLNALHDIIQCVFQWENDHLHEFSELRPKGNFIESEDEMRISLQDFMHPRKVLIYTYDFGDNWEHRVTFERKAPDYKVRYATVIEYEGDNFQEDSGGVWSAQDSDEDRIPFDLNEINLKLSRKIFPIFDGTASQYNNGQSRHLESCNVVVGDDEENSFDVGSLPFALRRRISQLDADDRQEILEILEELDDGMDYFPPETEMDQRLRNWLNRDESLEILKLSSSKKSFELLADEDGDSIIEICKYLDIEVYGERTEDTDAKDTEDSRSAFQRAMVLVTQDSPDTKSRIENSKAILQRLKEQPSILAYIFTWDEIRSLQKFFHMSNGFCSELPEEETVVNAIYLGLLDAGEETVNRRRYFALKPAADAKELLDILSDGEWEQLCGKCQKSKENYMSLLKMYSLIEFPVLCEKYRNYYDQDATDGEIARCLYLSENYCDDICTFSTADGRFYAALDYVDTDYVLQSWVRDGIEQMEYRPMLPAECYAAAGTIYDIYPEWKNVWEYLDEHYDADEEGLADWVRSIFCSVKNGITENELWEDFLEEGEVVGIDEFFILWGIFLNVYLRTGLPQYKGYSRGEYAVNRKVDLTSLFGGGFVESISRTTHLYQMPPKVQLMIYELSQHEDDYLYQKRKLEEILQGLEDGNCEIEFYYSVVLFNLDDHIGARKYLRGIQKIYPDDSFIASMLEVVRKEIQKQQKTANEAPSIWDQMEKMAGGNPPKANTETYRRQQPKIGRNDPCPCGSGKKYKKCCGK